MSLGPRPAPRCPASSARAPRRRATRRRFRSPPVKADPSVEDDDLPVVPGQRRAPPRRRRAAGRRARRTGPACSRGHHLALEGRRAPHRVHHDAAGDVWRPRGERLDDPVRGLSWPPDVEHHVHAGAGAADLLDQRVEDLAVPHPPDRRCPRRRACRAAGRRRSGTRAPAAGCPRRASAASGPRPPGTRRAGTEEDRGHRSGTHRGSSAQGQEPRQLRQLAEQGAQRLRVRQQARAPRGSGVSRDVHSAPEGAEHRRRSARMSHRPGERPGLPDPRWDGLGVRRQRAEGGSLPHGAVGLSALTGSAASQGS